MFQTLYRSSGKKVCLKVTMRSDKPITLSVMAEEAKKPNSKYVSRLSKVHGERVIYLSFPISPEVLYIRIQNKENPADKSFDIKIEEAPFKSYNVWISSETVRFLALANHFCKVAGYAPATEAGALFQTDDAEFTIKYFNTIKVDGSPISTPARIGHRTGIIDAAKTKMETYTVPSRMIILLHEYSHKYKNPTIGLDISNEKGADINALYIYLGLGFSSIDAIQVFANVFLKAQTPSNIERMRLIMDYIQRFEAEEFTNSITT